MTDWTSFYGPVDDRTQSTLAKACLEYFRALLDEARDRLAGRIAWAPEAALVA